MPTLTTDSGSVVVTSGKQTFRLGVHPWPTRLPERPWPLWLGFCQIRDLWGFSGTAQVNPRHGEIAHNPAGRDPATWVDVIAWHGHWNEGI